MFRLLYIDDDPGLGRLIQKHFERAGHSVDLASDGDMGLALLAERTYDICALDHHMPGRDGLEVLPDILAMQNAPPVVFVTGAQDGRMAVTALRAGAADYVIKDASEDFLPLLIRAVEDALERRRLQQEAERVQAEVIRERDRAEALLREVNHRVGNSLQLVTSFIHFQRRQLSDSGAQEALERVQTRIEAVAQVHRLLYTSGDATGVELQDYLRSLVGELASSLSSDTGPRLVCEADKVRISTDQAVAVGVIVAELVTNAVKYAYRDGPAGEVRVLLRAGEARLVSLAVEDDGGGMGDANPQGTGLGSQILAAMATDLCSRLSYETSDKGTRASLIFKAEDVRKSSLAE